MPQENLTQAQVIDSLPAHLRPFVAHQNYDDYTPRDHAVWRFLLHQLKHNLSSSAQPTYLEGLQRTGISQEAIPRIEDINACLGKLNWRAVVVDGFLPPAIFMEFQAIKVLVIAVNMRSYEHMLYTPAPDIVHESAGHAPFLIDIDYAEFLQRFGEYGMQAISDQEDMAVYEAVRNLSIVKEDANATDHDVVTASEQLDKALKNNDKPSEAALLARLHWWTVEYGLVGDTENYFIYGAGLLSSLGESVACLDDQKVVKRPLTVNAINSNYDITAPQPQLFVTESCRHLSQILEEFGRKMACRVGGKTALKTALNARTVTTIEFNSGLQTSGQVSRVLEDAVGNTIYINTDGPTQLCYAGKQLEGQGLEHHPHGFSSPIGRLVGFERCLSTYTVDELKRHQIVLGKPCELNYLSGISIRGELRAIVRREQQNILLTFSNCTVINIEGELLFDPAWGTYDMAVGDSVVSVRGGSADPITYPIYDSPSNTATSTLSPSVDTAHQFKLYAQVRNARTDSSLVTAVVDQVEQLKEPDWLLIYEVIELLEKHGNWPEKASSFRQRLETQKLTENNETSLLIEYALARTHAAGSTN